MQFRLGTCSSCDAQYKVPASFEAKQARCKSCGGAVDIGPVQSAETSAAPAPAKPAPKAPPVPARKPKPAEAQAAAPAPPAAPKPQREGPSMKEKLLARRAEETSRAPAPAPAPAAKAAPKPAPAPAARATPKPVARPAAKPAAARAGADADAGEGAERPSRAARGARPGARGASRSRGKRGGEKNKNPMLILGSLAGLLVIAGIVGFVLLSGDEEVAAKNDGAVAAAPDAGKASSAKSNAPDETDAGSSADDAASPAANAPDDADTGDETGADGAETPDPSADGAEGSDGGESTPAPRPASAEDSNVDLDSVDLTAIEDYGPIEGVSDEAWADLQKWAAQMIDPNAGAAGNRARNKLLEAGKAAFPAVLNELKALDFTTDQGRKDGDLCQRFLTELCNGNNFGWRYTTDPGDALFNKKVVRSWAKQWDSAKDNDEYWLRLSKQKDVGQEQPEEDAAAKRQKALDALDDI